MNIIWHGDSYFRLSVSKERNSTIEVAIEPFSKESGLKVPKVKADIVIERGGKYEEIEGSPFIISNEGEYEIGGVFVERVSYGPDKFFSLIDAEDLIICHLGREFNIKELDSAEAEIISGCDLLMIPITEPKEAAAVIAQVEPKIAIPMNFKPETIKEFLKIMGVDSKEETSKLTIKAKDLVGKEETEVIVLTI